MKIGIIGAGKVGVTIGKYLSLKGISIGGYFSRTRASADSAATFTGSGCFTGLEELVENCDTIFITTPDDAIGNVWEQLKKPLGKYIKTHDREYTVCHFSGSLSSNIFSGIDGDNIRCCSIHPMYAFSDKETSYLNFHNAVMTMEGNRVVVDKLRQMFEAFGHTCLVICARDKLKYHAAAVLASNAMIGLYKTSIDLLGECGFDESQARTLINPLVKVNVEAMLSKGCADSLTGPVERADVETVKKHLENITDASANTIYRELSKRNLQIARQKYAGQENVSERTEGFDAIEKILQGDLK